MNRILSLVIALVLALSVCGFTASAEGERMTIQWLGGHDTDAVPDDDPVVAWLEDMFDVDIDVWFIERENANELLTTRFMADEVPDIFFIEDYSLFSTFVRQGYCLELPMETIQEFMPNSYAWLMDFDPNCFDLVSFGGKNYGLPRVNMDGYYSYAPFWRADWLQQMGYAAGETPLTLDEFEEAFYYMANEDPDGNGIKDTYALSNMGMNPIFGAFGAIPDRWVDDGEGNLVYGAVYPGMKDALELLAKWYADGLVDPEFITGENQGGHWCLSVPFENGTLGFSSSAAFYQLEPDFDPDGSTFKVGKALRNFTTTHSYDDMIIGYNPVGPDGFTGGDNWGLTTAEAVCFSYKLAEEPEKLEKILEIVDVINSDYEVWKVIWNWDLNLDAYNYDDLLGFIKVDPDYERPGSTPHTNMFNTLQNPFFKMTATPSRYNWANSMDQFLQPGYSRTKLAITTASMPQYWTAMENYRLGTYVEFITGAKSIDEWDSFVETWYSIGGEIITEEANEWYHK